MVGPPFDELSCSCAMKLRIKWSVPGSLILHERLFIRLDSPRIRQVYCWPGQIDSCRLRHEQNHRYSTGYLQPAGRRL